MSAHDGIDRVEQLLRSAPAPTSVPPGLIDVAREAALGGGERRTVIAVARPRVPRLRFARLAAGVAVMAAAAAAALVIGVGGRGPSFDSHATLVVHEEGHLYTKSASRRSLERIQALILPNLTTKKVRFPGLLVELGGLEPPASWVRSRRSPN